MEATEVAMAFPAVWRGRLGQGMVMLGTMVSLYKQAPPS